MLTFVGETRILAINEDDELDEAELAGFDQLSQVPGSLACLQAAGLLPLGHVTLQQRRKTVPAL